MCLCVEPSHAGRMNTVKGSLLHNDMIPDYNGYETNCLLSKFITLSITCDYLLVECREPVTTEPTATTVTTVTTAPTGTKSPTEDESSGGVSIAVLSGIGGGVMVVLIVAILIIIVLIMVISKKKKSRCMHGPNIANS